MTKLWVMSDLHWEFRADGGRSFLESLPDVDYDWAIVAGDLCDFPRIDRSLRMLSERFESVVYVIGNHECYGASIGEALDAAEFTASRLDNVHVLERGTVSVGDGIFTPGTPTRIHGASLWFPYDGHTRAEEGMTDFYTIRGLRKDVDYMNRKAVKFLEDSVKPGDVVVTHHLPSTHSIDSRYAGSALNQFFVGAAAHVFQQKPALWVHGHTHTSVDKQVQKTRVVCNPFGYAGNELNPDFDDCMVVEV